MFAVGERESCPTAHADVRVNPSWCGRGREKVRGGCRRGWRELRARILELLVDVRQEAELPLRLECQSPRLKVFDSHLLDLGACQLSGQLCE